MTVGELIESLSDFPVDAEVRLMTQPSWPFENRVAGVCAAQQLTEPDCGESEEFTEEDVKVVYIVEGGQIGYGNKTAWEVIR